MARRIFGTALGVLTAALIAGCQGDPNHGRYTRIRPDPKEIAGPWSLDVAASDWRPPAADGTPHVLEFGADGTVVARNIPDIWNYDNRAVKGDFESGAGTWTLEKDQDYWVIQLHLSQVAGEKPGQNRLLHLVGQSPPYQIVVVIGDPDEGRSLVFSKERPGR
jgi:hypothetical protein